MVTRIIAFCIFPGIAMAQDSAGQQTEGSQSVYVARMMSLDRDGDGSLSESELPRSLTKLFEYDTNNDRKLDRRELANVERAAMAGRDDRDSHDKPSGRRRNANRPNSDAKSGSPLDPEQILRFALTFDTNKDGGLDAAELRRYANALAIRRAKGRRRDPNSGSQQQSSEPLKSDKRTKGLGAPTSKDDPALPFGPR